LELRKERKREESLILKQFTFKGLNIERLVNSMSNSERLANSELNNEISQIGQASFAWSKL
jgi:delta-aminolevulinic acid dehydratase/porphobilinogen synthase